ncbi:MAG: hypothetical protein QM589_10860, partial [Thermomicrobiales bacterium]
LGRRRARSPPLSAPAFARRPLSRCGARPLPAFGRLPTACLGLWAIGPLGGLGAGWTIGARAIASLSLVRVPLLARWRGGLLLRGGIRTPATTTIAAPSARASGGRWLSWHGHLAAGWLLGSLLAAWELAAGCGRFGRRRGGHIPAGV